LDKNDTKSLDKTKNIIFKWIRFFFVSTLGLFEKRSKVFEAISKEERTMEFKLRS